MNTNIIDFLENSVKKFATKTAFVQDGRKISYADFDIATDIIAEQLISFSKSCILVLLPKSIEALIGFIATVKSGNFYSAVDYTMPKQRLKKVVNRLKPKLIITSEKFDFDYLGIEVLKIENFSKFYKKYDFKPSIDFLPNTDYLILKKKLSKIKQKSIDVDLIYVLFTSGSTGEPKGISATHKNLIDYISWACKALEITDKDIIANEANFYFDKSVLDIYSNLAVAASMHIMPNNTFTFGDEMLRYFEKHNITMWGLVPQIIVSYANSGLINKYKLLSLKKICISGEITPSKQLNIWRRALPNTKIINLYGPSETTGICAYYVFDRQIADDEIIPIGKACENMEILLIDDKNNLISKNETDKKGIIYIRGTGVTVGYYANAELSSHYFIQNPLHKNFTDTLYKTGDVAAYNKYGELVVYGRSDLQVKIAGHRVELGEIESVIGSHNKVQNVACVAQDNVLHCFYVGENYINFREFLKDKLNSYMIPRFFHKINKFALNQNGKIDRLALKNRLK